MNKSKLLKSIINEQAAEPTEEVEEPTPEWMLVVNGWKSVEAASYVKRLVEVFGSPKAWAVDRVLFGPLAGFDEVLVRDEAIPHAHPAPHIDFVYSWKAVPNMEAVDGKSTKITQDFTGIVAKATGSIFIDGLKGVAGSRCGMLVKNAISAGFVEDVWAGKIKAHLAREEYSRRIIHNIVPTWYKDEMKEIKGTVR